MIVPKLNPFQQLYEVFKGFTYPNSYYTLRRQSVGSRILYGLIASVIACIFTFVIGGFQISNDETLQMLIEEMPEFTYSNGILTCDKKEDQEYGDSYLYLDTDYDSFILSQDEPGKAGTDISAKLKEILNHSNATSIMFVSSTNVVNIKRYGAQYNYQSLNLSDLFGLFGINELSKAAVLAGYKGVIMKIALLAGAIVLPFRLLGMFFFALLWSIVALIMNAVMKGKQDFPTLYWISFYIYSLIMVIMALEKSLFSWSTGTVTIVFMIIIVIMLYNTIRNGDPYLEPVMEGNGPAQSSVPVTGGFGVVQDNFDDFMKDSYEEPVLQPYRSTSDVSEENDNLYENDSQETFWNAPQPTNSSSTGLSLKRDE